MSKVNAITLAKPTWYRTATLWAICRRLLVVSSVFFYASCTDVDALVANLDEKCAKNPESVKCQSYKTVELFDNPSTVGIKNSERNSSLVVLRGDLEGLAMSFEKGSFEGSLNLDIELKWTKPETNLVGASPTQLTNSFGLDDDELMPKLSVIGSTRLIKPAKLTLPNAMTDSMTRDELNSFLLELTNQAGKITVIPNADILVTGTGINTTYSIMLSDWGHMKTLSGKPKEEPDITPPTVTLTSSAGTTTNVSPIPVSIIFSEDVTGFDPDDLIVGNGTVEDMSGSGSTYTANITASTQGTVTIDVAAKAAIDAAQNPSSTATQLSIVYDATVPSVGAFSASTGVGNTGFTLNWTAATDSVTPTADLQYLVCSGANTGAINTVSECESTQGTANLVMDWTANTRTKVLTGLTPSTTYYYNVLVRDGAGNKSIYGGRTQSTTADTTVPTPGSSSSPTNISPSSMTLAWTASSDTVTSTAALEYYTCRANSSADINTVSKCETGGAATQVMNWTSNTLTATATNLTPATTYFFRTLVRDGAGNKSIYASVFGTTTTSGFTTTSNGVRDSSSQHTFYDAIHSRHWIFYLDGGDLKYRYSADNITWTVGTAMGAPATKFAIHYKSVNGTPYVFMVNEESSFDIVVRRGDLTSSGVTFGSPVTVFDGTSLSDSYKGFAVVTDDTNLWIAASRFNGSLWQAVVKESTNSADSNLDSWQAVSNLGALSANPKTITLLPKGGEDLYAVYKDGEAVIGYTYSMSADAWSAADTGADFEWLNLSGSNGTNGNILVAAWLGSDFYVGGNFTIAGGISARNIAKWDGSSWSSLGSGVSNTVNALAVIGSDLYVGGRFTMAGGLSANRIAKWNGSSWSALGTGVNNHVRALANRGNDLYVGGEFTTAGGSSASRIAKWNGSTWSALGSGVSSTVYALAASDNDLYVGGEFATAGGTSANFVAKWNGSAWSALGSGVNNIIFALAASGSDLYVGGVFTMAGGSTANYVAKWNGSSWSALGSGVNNEVYALAASGSDLYVGGWFTEAGGSNANCIAKWDGSSWSTLGGVKGMNSTVSALVVNGSELFAGGSFTFADSSRVKYIAKWNGSAWSGLGTSGINGEVKAFAMSDTGMLYIAGNFTTAGGISANYIAKWDGTSWSALGQGLNNTVNALVLNGSDLYVGGSFYHAGGNTAYYIAKWNGTSWSSLGSGVNGDVNTLAIIGNDLYAGGSFSTAGGNSANYIAKWDGTSWSALDSGVDGVVRALAVSSSEDLYVGGWFTNAGGISANYIAKWDGSSWSALDSGLNNSASALAFSGSDLYVGGDFTQAGGNSANRVARWRINKSSYWTSLDSGLNGSVTSLASYGKTIYVSGYFTTAGGSSIKNTAQWDGSSWSSLGNVTTGTGSSAIANLNGILFYGSSAGLAVLTSSITSTMHPISAAVNNNNDLSITYIDLAGLVKAKTFTSDEWTPATNIQATGVSSAPQITSVPGTDDFVAFWYRSGAWEYKRFDGTSWEASPTTLIPAGVNSRYASCDPFAGDSIIKCIATSKTTSPFDVSIWSVTP